LTRQPKTTPPGRLTLAELQELRVSAGIAGLLMNLSPQTFSKLANITASKIYMRRSTPHARKNQQCRE
jgi:hypothetical protein